MCATIWILWRLPIRGGGHVQKKLNVKFKQREFNGDEALVLEDVSKAFGEKRLFSDLSLTVTGGERIAIIGDNGTGKSTLIKLIMGE